MTRESQYKANTAWISLSLWLVQNQVLCVWQQNGSGRKDKGRISTVCHNRENLDAYSPARKNIHKYMGLSGAQNAECLQATEVLQIEVKCNLSRAKYVRQLAHQFTLNSCLFNWTYLLYKWTINKLHSVSTRDLSAKAKAKLNLANQEIASFVLNLTTKIMVNYITQLFKHDGWIIPRLIHTSGMVTSARALQGDSLFIDRKL